jgi:CDGSH-type Zn-finger protein
MARLVRHDAQGPYRIEPQDFPNDKPIFICACGLTQRPPYCDGSHKGCKAEVEGTLYVYDAERKAVQETRPET